MHRSSNSISSSSDNNANKATIVPIDRLDEPTLKELYSILAGFTLTLKQLEVLHIHLKCKTQQIRESMKRIHIEQVHLSSSLSLLSCICWYQQSETIASNHTHKHTNTHAYTILYLATIGSKIEFALIERMRFLKLHRVLRKASVLSCIFHNTKTK